MVSNQISWLVRPFPLLTYPCSGTLSSIVQLKKATMLAESSCFSYVSKLIFLLQSPGFSQVGATLFSHIYLFVLLCNSTINKC